MKPLPYFLSSASLKAKVVGHNMYICMHLLESGNI